MDLSRIKEPSRRFLRRAAAILLLVGCFVSAGGIKEAAGEKTVKSNVTVHAPDTPPDGLPYDRWKGIEYTQDTVFSIPVGWKLRIIDKYADKLKEYIWDPSGHTARFSIDSVRAEPVGGEMKLRSGGYVDITIAMTVTVELRYSYPREHDNGTDEISLRDILDDNVSGIRFSSPKLHPFDLYTGTLLLNFIDDGGNNGIDVLQATDSGFTESRVMWHGRIFRLLAREDVRNTSAGEFHREVKDSRIVVTIPGSAEAIYTFRVPADYDGLALAIPRSTIYPEGFDPFAEQEPDTDVYAEILKGDDGGSLPTEDYWFIRVSDLLERPGAADGSPDGTP